MASDRSSEADEPILVNDAQEVAHIEAENTLQQFDAAMDELKLWVGKEQYRLRPSTIMALNRIALKRLSKYAGIPRPGGIKISGSEHIPVDAADVPRLLEEFCDYINSNWKERNAVHLSAYALWKINWIHPFVDGNGRTARIVSYLIMCAHLGYRLPGVKTIPEQIAAGKKPYYVALEAADSAFSAGQIDVSRLEQLIDAHLAVQLLDVHKKAVAGSLSERSAIPEMPKGTPAALLEVPDKRLSKISRFVSHVEKHPVIYTFAGGLFFSIIAIVFS